ncbi:hypothetical protein LTR62_004200 [Meristemomyces frigidus]|uniref:Uncharacterized protein n=1 Tax=Meristemomyces frigidus TaxID=1508187 RepID=A0AAN7THR5_9PEZI|nr:hypothetical protein LTR62_004200 [Meristemomyces frigidus]
MCATNATDCSRAVKAEALTCAPSWNAYYASASHAQSLGPAWAIITSTSTVVYSGTTTIYTSFSTADEVFTRNGFGIQTTFTPIYALGGPGESLWTKTYSSGVQTHTTTRGPTPDLGGTVELFYWPATATGSSNGPTDRSPSTVLDGTTLHYPSAYISFQTAYATDSCSTVGSPHTGAIIGLLPQEVSTLVHDGGKVAQSGANQYGPLDYGALTGLPQASLYESQQSCLVAGCLTIYPSFQPTLVVPAQMRKLDPAWMSCGLGLEGFRSHSTSGLGHADGADFSSFADNDCCSNIFAIRNCERDLYYSCASEFDPEYIFIHLFDWLAFHGPWYPNRE